MRIYVYPADTGGCGWYRLRWPAEAVAKLPGFDVRIVRPTDEDYDTFALRATIDEGTDRVVGVNFPADADVVVMQRVAFKYLRGIVPLLRQCGVAVVIDMDDDLHNIHPKNPAYRHFHPDTDNGYTWETARESCLDATLVTVSTDALLARYAPHGRGLVLRNCVPAAYLDILHRDSDQVGWGGALASHPDDPQVMGGAIRRLSDEGHPFHLIGDPAGVADVLGLQRLRSSGPVKLARWPFQLSKLGVGVAPLNKSIFNDSKSWLKPIEMSALGVPWVASPSPEYTRLHQLGTGLLADTPSDWYRHLKTLATSRHLRAEMSAAGREIAAGWTIEGNAHLWAQAWAAARDIQRAETGQPLFQNPQALAALPVAG